MKNNQKNLQNVEKKQKKIKILNLYPPKILFQILKIVFFRASPEIGSKIELSKLKLFLFFKNQLNLLFYLT